MSVLTTAAWLNRNGNPDAAQMALGGYLATDPGNLQVRLEYARMLAFAQKYPEALQQFQTVLASDPANLSAQVGVAKVHSWQNRFAAALEGYDRVLARAPGHYDASVGKAFTLLWMGRRAEAIPLFEAAARRNPGDPEVAAVLKSLNLRAVAANRRDRAVARLSGRGNTPSPNDAAEPVPVSAELPYTDIPAAEAQPSPERNVLQAAVIAPAAGFIFIAGAFLAYRRVRARHVLPRRRTLRLPAGMPTRRGRVQPPLQQSLAGARFLVVERDVDSLGFVQMVLAACGAAVTSCRSGEEAARYLAAREFDVVLLDTALDGNWCTAELCAWLERAYPGGARRAMLVMDATPSRLERRMALQSRAVCLTRPFSARDLEVMARLALSRSRAAWNALCG